MATEEKVEDATEEQENTDFDLEKISDEDISNMSDEEVDNLNAQIAEGMEAQESEDQDKGAESQETEGASDGTQEEVAGTQASQEEKPEEKAEDSTQTVSMEEHDKLKAHSKEQELFEQRRSNELGQLRQQNATLLAQQSKPAPKSLANLSPDEVERINALDPVAANAEMRRIEDEARTQADSNAQMAHQNLVSGNTEMIRKFAPDWREHEAEMETYLGEVVGPQDARAFVANPAADQSGGFTTKILTDMMKARKETASVQAELKALKENVGKFQKRVKNVTGATKPLGNIGSSDHTDQDPNANLREEDVRKLSDEALDKLIADAEKKG